jgi:hypothetical protein
MKTREKKALFIEVSVDQAKLLVVVEHHVGRDLVYNPLKFLNVLLE